MIHPVYLCTGVSRTFGSESRSVCVGGWYRSLIDIGLWLIDIGLCWLILVSFDWHWSLSTDIGIFGLIWVSFDWYRSLIDIGLFGLILVFLDWYWSLLMIDWFWSLLLYLGFLCRSFQLKMIGLFCKAKETYKRDYILQKRPIILRSLLIVGLSRLI